MVLATGLAGGLVGATYLALLEVVEGVLGPESWAPGAHVLVLVGVGGVVALATRLLGRPADVELLVDNIHVLGGADEVRSLGSLIPVSLLCIGAGALEILHRRGLEYYEAILPSVFGALCGYGVYTAATGLGLEPIFDFPTSVPLTVADLGWGVAAGVGGAAVAVAFTYLCAGLRLACKPVPEAVRPVLGGLALVVLALVSPFALTNGEAQITALATSHVAVATLLGAAAVKLVASAVSLITGWKGGFIIPLFFVGFCLARAAAGHTPGGDEWILAAGLMAACNVGVTKTPIGSTLVVTEMAGMGVLPPTLIAAVVSMALTSSVGLIDTQRRRLDGSSSEEETDG
jgi:H+/Cl- antiporter ClcA